MSQMLINLGVTGEKSVVKHSVGESSWNEN